MADDFTFSERNAPFHPLPLTTPDQRAAGLVRLTTTLVDNEPLENLYRLAKQLRTAFDRVQGAKRRGRPDPSVLWDAINSMPGIAADLEAAADTLAEECELADATRAAFAKESSHAE